MNTKHLEMPAETYGILSRRSTTRKVECTPDSIQVVKQQYLKPPPFQTDQVICIRELNAAFSCCKPSR
jgi:hypothetical protein